jgi:hypothetical protein
MLSAEQERENEARLKAIEDAGRKHATRKHFENKKHQRRKEHSEKLTRSPEKLPTRPVTSRARSYEEVEFQDEDQWVRSAPSRKSKADDIANLELSADFVNKLRALEDQQRQSSEMVEQLLQERDGMTRQLREHQGVVRDALHTASGQKNIEQETHYVEEEEHYAEEEKEVREYAAECVQSAFRLHAAYRQAKTEME